MEHPPQILLIAAQTAEQAAIQGILSAAPGFGESRLDIVASASMLDELLAGRGNDQPYDLMLTELALDGVAARQIVAQVRRAMPDTPVVLLAGTDDEGLIAALAPDIAAPVVSKTSEALAGLPAVLHAVLWDARQASQAAPLLTEPTSQNIFAHSRAAMLLIDPENLAIRDANRAARRFYGYSRAELCGRTMVDLTIEPRYELRETLAQALREDPAGPLVCRQRLISGELRDVELYVSPITCQDHILLHAVIHDVTDRLLIERALHQSEERFRRIAENAPDMIFRWSYARGFEYVNPAATEVIGYTPEEHYEDPGLGYRSIHMDDLPVYESVFSDLADPEGPRRYCVIRWIHKKGHLVHVEMRMTPIFDEHGNLIAIEGIARDISQHVRARARLRELTTRLTQAHEEERRRLARELHDEIGQAMTIARIRTSMIAKSLPEEAREAREKIAMLDTLIREMLQNVRALSHELRPPLLDEMGWRPALEALCDSFSQRTGLPVQFIQEGKDERIDPDMELTVYRVVQEALTNIARHANATEATVRANLSEDGMSLIIEDNGTGFDVEAVMQAAGPEMGLGLVSMLERVDTVGGQIDISSAPGRGTRIHARLPREEG